MAQHTRSTYISLAQSEEEADCSYETLAEIHETVRRHSRKDPDFSFYGCDTSQFISINNLSVKFVEDSNLHFVQICIIISERTNEVSPCNWSAYLCHFA
jgi:hypothetical protein